MANNTSVSPGTHVDEFIAQRLRQLLAEGEQSGFVDYDYDTLMEEMDKNPSDTSV